MEVNSKQAVVNTNHMNSKEQTQKSSSNLFSNLLDANTKSSNTQKQNKQEETNDIQTITSRTTRQLVEDLISMIKTGFTVQELESIEKLLAEIKKKLQKESLNSDEKENIKKMLDELEAAIARIQKRITGDATIKANDKNTQSFNNSDSDIEGFKKRIESIEKRISNLKASKLSQFEFDSKENNSTSTKEELELRKNLHK